MNNLNYSHLSFSDDSSHEDDRFKSLSLVIFPAQKYSCINSEINEILLNSGIEKTDKKIDQEVYKLYELTEEEIKIIEEAK